MRGGLILVIIGAFLLLAAPLFVRYVITPVEAVSPRWESMSRAEREQWIRSNIRLDRAVGAILIIAGLLFLLVAKLTS